MEVWVVLEEEINQELELIKKIFSSGNSIAILEIVRCVDDLFYLISYGKGDITVSLSEIWSLQTNGFYELLNLFIKNTDIDNFIPLAPTNPDLINWTNPQSSPQSSSFVTRMR